MLFVTASKNESIDLKLIHNIGLRTWARLINVKSMINFLCSPSTTLLSYKKFCFREKIVIYRRDCLSGLTTVGHFKFEQKADPVCERERAESKKSIENLNTKT